MTTKNDITGDLIKTKPTKNKNYENNYDAIFKKDESKIVPTKEVHKEKPL